MTSQENYLNVNIPFFWGFLDTAFLCDREPSAANERIPMEFFLYTSIPNRCGLFTGMSEWGTQHARIPIHYIHTEPTGGVDYPLDFLQLWDSFSYHCSALTIDYIKNRSCKVLLKDRSIIDGTYMFTLDWCNGGYSEIAAGHKTGHVINANGRVFIQPNNRIVRWNDGGAFTSKTLKGRPDWKVFSQEFSCEASASRWVADSDDELYWYGFKETEKGVDDNNPSE
jgi:hypothetical protein